MGAVDAARGGFRGENGMRGFGPHGAGRGVRAAVGDERDGPGVVRVRGEAGKVEFERSGRGERERLRRAAERDGERGGGAAGAERVDADGERGVRHARGGGDGAEGGRGVDVARALDPDAVHELAERAGVGRDAEGDVRAAQELELGGEERRGRLVLGVRGGPDGDAVRDDGPGRVRGAGGAVVLVAELVAAGAEMAERDVRIGLGARGGLHAHAPRGGVVHARGGQEVLALGVEDDARPADAVVLADAVDPVRRERRVRVVERERAAAEGKPPLAAGGARVAVGVDAVEVRAVQEEERDGVGDVGRLVAAAGEERLAGDRLDDPRILPVLVEARLAGVLRRAGGQEVDQILRVAGDAGVGDVLLVQGQQLVDVVEDVRLGADVERDAVRVLRGVGGDGALEREVRRAGEAGEVHRHLAEAVLRGGGEAHVERERLRGGVVGEVLDRGVVVEPVVFPDFVDRPRRACRRG